MPYIIDIDGNGDYTETDSVSNYIYEMDMHLKSLEITFKYLCSVFFNDQSTVEEFEESMNRYNKIININNSPYRYNRKLFSHS